MTVSTDSTKQTILDTYEQWQHTEKPDGFCLTRHNNSIQFISQANRGAPAARNNGLKQASGTYIKFLDSDDLLVEDALLQEFDQAEKQSCDALLTGWILLTVDEQANTISEQPIEAPDLSNGVDDMLEGKGPCASAGFYRRSKIMHLRWDETINKAQDWMWAWTVCLEGIKFSTLPIASSIYVQHQSDQRITQQGNSMHRSTVSRIRILNKVEEILNNKDLMTAARAEKLAQYYYKDARMMCQLDPIEWYKLYSRINTIAPNYSIKETNPIVRFFIHIFGLHKGILYFVQLRSIVKIFRKSTDQ